MPSLSRTLRAAVLPLLVALPLTLAACDSGGSSASAPKPDKSAENYDQLMLGRSVFSDNCAKCHGASGEGVNGPALQNGAAKQKFPDVDDEITWVKNGGSLMPGFGGSLSPKEIAAVVAYTREVL